MIEATTEAHTRHYMQIAHLERAQAFADAWKWIMKVMSSKSERAPRGLPVGC